MPVAAKNGPHVMVPRTKNVAALNSPWARAPVLGKGRTPISAEITGIAASSARCSAVFCRVPSVAPMANMPAATFTGPYAAAVYVAAYGPLSDKFNRGQCSQMEYLLSRTPQFDLIFLEDAVHLR